MAISRMFMMILSMCLDLSRLNIVCNAKAFEHIMKDASNKLEPVIFVLTGLLSD